MLDVHEPSTAARCSRCWRCAGGDLRRTGASSAEPVARGARAGAVDRREARARGRAVEPRGDRSLRVHAGDLRRARAQTQPGVGGEIQLTDAIGLLLDARAGVRRRVLRGPLRHRPEDRLPARQHRARPRPRRPPRRPRAAARRPRAQARPRRRRVVRVGPARRRRARRSSPRSRALADRVECALVDAVGLVLARDVIADGAGAAVRQHRDGRLRRARRRHRRARRRRAGVAARRRRAAGRARADDRRSVRARRSAS